jgi:iron complex transport system substrate-binding protein
MTFPPERIICLTEETVETLYLLEEDWRIVGVSGYAVRPARVRKEKPRVSAFTSADIPKILALKPDLVFTFSDLQAEIVASLIREGIEVHAFNQRSIAGILDMVRMVGAITGKANEGIRLAEQLSSGLEAIRAEAEAIRVRPRLYFEEWDDPMISGIGWVSEIVGAAGGVDVFADRAMGKSAKDRIVSAEEVIAAAPDIIIGSWCGKRFRPERVCGRPGFDTIPAVKSGALREVKSPLILQPGPAALTDGAQVIAAIIRDWIRIETA